MVRRKYFIISDFEGLSGVVNWRETNRKDDYNYFREVQLQELNKMIETIEKFDKDALIYIRDFHGDMRNILFPKIKGKNVKIIRGSLSNTVGLEFDETFSGIILHGFHAKTATLKAVLPHAFSSKIRIFLNGKEIGETGLLGAVASLKGIPVIFLTGDRAVCEEYHELDSKTETLSVKEGYSPVCAVCDSLEMVLLNIEKKLQQALKDQDGRRVEPFFKAPYDLKIEFSSPTLALLSSFIPSVEVDGLTMRFKTDELSEIYRLMIIIYILISQEKNL